MLFIDLVVSDWEKARYCSRLVVFACYKAYVSA